METCLGTRPSRAHGHGEPRSRAGATRRSVVRAGAAWSAPLVQVIAAAPAQAVGSGVTLTMTGTFTHATGTRAVSLASGNVANTGTQATTNLQVTVTLTSNGSNSLSGTTVTTTPTGWTVGAGTTGGSSGAFTITFVFGKTVQATANSNNAFAPAFQIPNNARNTAGSGSATATSTGAASSNTSNGYSG